MDNALSDRMTDDRPIVKAYTKRRSTIYQFWPAGSASPQIECVSFTEPRDLTKLAFLPEQGHFV